MTTSVRVINFGPRSVYMFVGNVEPGVVGTELLYAGQVSGNICLHSGQQVLVQEVQEKPEMSKPIPVQAEFDDPLIAGACAKIASGELVPS